MSTATEYAWTVAPIPPRPRNTATGAYECRAYPARGFDAKFAPLMGRVLIIPVVLIALVAGAVVWSGGGVEKRADFAFINRGNIHTLDLNQMSYMQDFR